MRRLLLCTALLAAGACDCGGGGKINARTSDLKLKPDLQFGTVSVGRSSTLKATLENAGNDTITVEAMETAAPFSIAFTEPIVLLGGELREVEVTYTPTAPNAAGASDTGELAAINDSDAPRVAIALVGLAVQPKLVFSPPALDFGELDVGSIKDLSLTVENQGTEAVNIKEARLDSQVFGGELRKLETTLQPGSKVTANFTYTPNAGRVDEESLVLVTDMVQGNEVPVALRGKGLAAQLTLCYRLDKEGAEETCLPREGADGKLVYAGELDFGALDEGTSITASVTLTNEGNTQVALTGLEAGGATAVDRTARSNPCGLASATPDFTFAPANFGTKLPMDPTESEPNPPQSKSIEVSYQPHHECQGDLSDTGRMVFRAGSGPTAKTFELVLKGASRIGLVYSESLNLEVNRPEQRAYNVYNIGPGPLQVTSVEIVEGDDGTANPNTDCTQRCAERAACTAESTRVECQAFGWADGPNAIEIGESQADPGTGQMVPTPGQVGVLDWSPPVACVDLPTPDPDCGRVFKGCMRIHSNDPYRGTICAALGGVRLNPAP